MLELSRIQCLGEALRDSVLTYKSNVALIEANRKRENGRWTYREVKAQAERITGALLAGGFEPGDRCAVLMSNQARWLIGATGAFWAGATLVPLDYKLTPKEQLALLSHCAPNVLITEYPVWVKLMALDLAPLQETRIVVSEAPDGVELGQAVRWEALESEPFRLVMRAREDVAAIVYSSGTGGTPKGCMLTHHNYLAQAEVLGRLYPIEETDRYFSVLPTNHAIDFMCGYIIPFLFGSAIVHQRTLRPQFLGPTMKRYQITHMSLVPLILKKFEEKVREQLDELNNWQRAALDGLLAVNAAATRKKPNHTLSRRLLRPIHEGFGNLKLMFCGGAFVDRESAEFFYKLGLPVAIGYGLTEAGTVLTVNDLEPFRGDTVGKPVAGTTIEIRNANDKGIGEVWASGPTVMKGYLNEPELTAESIVDGWLNTGDLGRIDAAGHLKLFGRKKNMIVTEGGKNIYPEDIEAAFEGIEGCEELAVFAANYVWPAETMTGEQLMVVLRLSKGQALSGVLKELRKRNRRLADFKRVTAYLEMSEEMPRTASMKLKRPILAKELAERFERTEALREL